MTLNAKEYLNQIQTIDFLIRELEEEKRDWKERTGNDYGVTTSYGESTIINGELHNMEKIGGASTNSQVEALAIKHSEIEMEYNTHIRLLREEKQEIVNTMRLTRPDHFKVLYKYYVRRMTLIDIANTFHKTESWANSIHGRALQEVQRILDERERNKKCKK